MNPSRSIVIERIPATDDRYEVETVVRFNPGGMNYANYQHEPKGYYLHVTPQRHESGMVVTTAFSGKKWLLETADRYNEKKLAAVAAEVRGGTLYPSAVEAVLTEQNLRRGWYRVLEGEAAKKTGYGSRVAECMACGRHYALDPERDGCLSPTEKERGCPDDDCINYNTKPLTADPITR